MRILICLATLATLLALLAPSGGPSRPPVVDNETLVYDVMRQLEMPERADIQVRPVAGASAELGRRLVLEGLRARGGQQSAHFKCTSCHNVVREDPVLTAADPEARLRYANEHDLPFLPGTTLWGAVNRETYYNGDYDKKYGDLVKNARRNLRGAIQLCATECAQGEPLNAVEMESVLAYLHTIGLRLGDLPATAPRRQEVNQALAGKNRESTVRRLKASYALASPATFVPPPVDREAGYDLGGGVSVEAVRGRAIYQRGCLHCHAQQRYSFYELDEDALHYRFLTKHFPRYTRYSTYQVARYGTSPIPGKRAYMPHYTAERMSDRQLEELRAYLAQAAAK